MKYFILNLLIFFSIVVNGQDPKTKKDSLSILNNLYFSVGTNLDFVSSNRTTGLYYDINVSIPSLNFNEGKFGIDLRLNQGKLTPTVDSSITITRNFFNSSISEEDSIFTIMLQNYSRREIDDISNTNISIFPSYVVFGENTISLIGFAQYSLVKQNLKTTYELKGETPKEVTKTQLDEIRTTSINLDRDIIRNNSFHNFNYGLGAKLFIEWEDVGLSVKGTLGSGGVYGSGGTFYYTHFEVIEKQFGLKIGGELRGVISGKNRTNAFNEPQIGLYIAKSIPFSKFNDILNLSL